MDRRKVLLASIKSKLGAAKHNNSDTSEDESGFVDQESNEEREFTQLSNSMLTVKTNLTQCVPEDIETGERMKRVGGHEMVLGEGMETDERMKRVRGHEMVLGEGMETDERMKRVRGHEMVLGEGMETDERMKRVGGHEMVLGEGMETDERMKRVGGHEMVLGDAMEMAEEDGSLRVTIKEENKHPCYTQLEREPGKYDIYCDRLFIK